MITKERGGAFRVGWEGHTASCGGLRARWEGLGARCQLVSLSLRASVRPSACLSVCLTVCLSVCLSVWLAGWLAGWLAVCGSGGLCVCKYVSGKVSVWGGRNVCKSMWMIDSMVVRTCESR